MIKDSHFMDHLEIQTEYRVTCNVLDIFQIRAAIPWVRHMSFQDENTQELTLFISGPEEDAINILKVSSKILYKSIQKKQEKIPTARNEWAETFPDLTPYSELWTKLYKTAFLAT